MRNVQVHLRRNTRCLSEFLKSEVGGLGFRRPQVDMETVLLDVYTIQNVLRTGRVLCNQVRKEIGFQGPACCKGYNGHHTVGKQCRLVSKAH